MTESEKRAALRDKIVRLSGEIERLNQMHRDWCVPDNARAIAAEAKLSIADARIEQLQDLLVKETRVNLRLLDDIDADVATIARVEAVCVTGTRVATERMVSGLVVHVAAKDAIDTFAKAIRAALLSSMTAADEVNAIDGSGF